MKLDDDDRGLIRRIDENYEWNRQSDGTQSWGENTRSRDAGAFRLRDEIVNG